jgi:hypothetical protein
MILGPLFIVNGEDVVPGGDYPTLGDAAKAALKLSRNTARPFEEWVIHRLDGALEDPARPLTSKDDVEKFFITLRVGAGG